MLDKLEVKIPASAMLRPAFHFIQKELRYAGVSSPVRSSQHYAGICDLRPFGSDAILHLNFKRGGAKNHKLEILESGTKSIRELGALIATVFDVIPDAMKVMRLDFAADMYGIPVTHLYDSLRVKFKRSANARGERDYETVGSRRLEYFRYGKSPNCVRVYDKPAECLARFQKLRKRGNPDAEPLTYEELFGFPRDTILTRVERQSGGGKIPEMLSTFVDLIHLADFNPFENIEVLPNVFPLPDPKRHGVARSLKLIGVHDCIDKYGYQQARAMLNCEGNAKRTLDDYKEYLDSCQPSIELTVDSIVDAYRQSVRKQIHGSIERPVRNIAEANTKLV